ncbi:MAG: hypothetical protein ACR2KQ_05005 [Actinomycetota bacterium]
MTDPVAPRYPERYRMPARVATIVLAYFLYRALLDDRVVGPALVAFGAFLVAGVVIDGLTTSRHERSELLTVGTVILGLGLLGIGIYLLVR